MKRMLSLVLATLPLLASAQQTVWRCGPDGRSYSDQPCPTGRVVALADTTRPAADVQAAQDRALREQALADTLLQQRLQREAATRGSGLGGFVAQQTVKPAAKARLQSKHQRRPASPASADADTWRAAVPASRHGRG
jgi:hypothetical protein